MFGQFTDLALEMVRMSGITDDKLITNWMWRQLAANTKFLLTLSGKGVDECLEVLRSGNERNWASQGNFHILCADGGSLRALMLLVEDAGYNPQAILIPNLREEMLDTLSDKIEDLCASSLSAGLAGHLVGCSECGYMYASAVPNAKFCPQCGHKLITRQSVGELHEKLSRTLESLDLSMRVLICMDGQLGIRYVGQLVQQDEGEMLRKVRNFGRRSNREIKDKLGSMGLSLGMTPEQLLGWEPPAT